MSIDEHSAALVYALVEVLLRDDPVLMKAVQGAIIQHLTQAGHNLHLLLKHTVGEDQR